MNTKMTTNSQLLTESKKQKLRKQLEQEQKIGKRDRVEGYQRRREGEKVQRISSINGR